MTSNYTNILHVEDNLGDARLIQEGLKEALGENYSLVRADSLETCVNFLEQGDFDVILLDLGLPDSQGFETLAKVKAKTQRHPIVIITGLDSKDMASKALQEGAQDYLIKGEIDARILKRAIQHSIERKKSSEALHQSEEKYRSIVENSEDQIFMLDKDYKFLSINKSGADLSGKSVQEMVGRSMFEIFPETIADQFSKNIKNVFETGKGIFLDEKITVLGREFYKNTSLNPVKDDTGRVIAVTGIVRDITERKRAEEALKESEEKFRTIFDNSAIGKSITAIDGSVNVNRAFCEMLGYMEEELLHQKWPDISHPDDYEITQKIIAQLLSGERKAAKFVKRYFKKDGSIVWADVNTVLQRDKDGKPLYFITAIVDLTDRKRMEKELLKASKLESLSLLAGGIAHDFNNILTGIMANISIARHLIKPGEEALEPIVDAEQASLRARDLVKQLLLFARGGSQARESTSLAKLLQEVTGFILSGSNVAPRFILSDDLWPIQADAGQIYQVFENLVINAKQAMNKGGTLEIRGENLVVGEESAPTLKPGRYVRVSVKDEGEGIPEQTLARIFDPYFTTKKEGSGLGLAIVFSIIKNHGGHISVESKAGEGTTFEVYLPALASDEEARVEIIRRSNGQTENGKGRILVMDDEESIRKTLGRLLGFMDYRVDFAVCGEEAIEMYRKAKEDGKGYMAAIMDLTIPGKMGGKEAAGIINGIDPEARLIVSSGYSDDDLMTNYKNYGFIGVMVKPYTLKELQETLEKVIQNCGMRNADCGMKTKEEMTNEKS